MLIYANSFWFEPAGGPAEIIQFIAKWVGQRARSFVDGDRLANGIRELKLRDGSTLTSNTTGNLAEGLTYPYLFSAQLSHRDETVSGRKWITEVGLRQEAAGEPVECSLLLKTDEVSARVTAPIQVTRPKLVEQLIRACKPAAETPGLSVKTLDENSAKAFLHEVDREARSYPLVLVSCARDGKYPLEPERLRSVLTGLADVVIVPSGVDTFAIEEAVGRRHMAFGGAVNVVFPVRHGSKGHFCETVLIRPDAIAEILNGGKSLESEVLAAKSYFFSEFSPYATLISGGQATKSTLFYNNARRKVGLVGFWDTVAFDEVGGIKVKDPDTIQIMKDFMANGRFSRGAEVIADASLSFVGNFDLSISQVVNSVKHDLFQPLPAEFDLAVMDRFAAYIPGWEMPKNSSAFLTNNYGFITDYLAEAFHHQFKHTNRYEEVTKRIRLGKSVEGRDEKGIKKTVCAFLKILHPSGTATDQEFEEYVAYAVECRRRVKEQMNKRKPDDEFARINLSYLRADGTEVVVFCPESKDASATQQPARTSLSSSEANALELIESHGTPRETAPAEVTEVAAVEATPTPVRAAMEPAPAEQHFTILYGDMGHTYESIMGPYLKGAKAVQVEDPYIRLPHQIQNFVRFCETVLKAGTVRKISLLTSFDDTTPLADMNDKLDQLRQSLLEQDVELEINVNPNLHDREVRLDNGWLIKIGRGLDFYQRPSSWFEIGAMDMSLRKCLETKVDIFKS